jgi:hypothetical protein
MKLTFDVDYDPKTREVIMKTSIDELIELASTPTPVKEGERVKF